MNLRRLLQRLQFLLHQQHTDAHEFYELGVHVLELIGSASACFRLCERGEIADELACIFRNGAAFANAARAQTVQKALTPAGQRLRPLVQWRVLIREVWFELQIFAVQRLQRRIEQVVQRLD